MRNGKEAIPISVIGVLVIALTLTIFFMLRIERTEVHGWALTFLLLSECVLFGGLIGLRFVAAKRSIVFLNAGAISALSLYFIATLVSVLFTGEFEEKLNAFILMELSFIVLAAIIILSLYIFSRKIERSNEADIKKVGTNEPKRGGF